MSSYEYCPRGGQEGIATTTDQQMELAQILGEGYRGTYIPLPNVSTQEQVKTIKENDHPHEAINSYDFWENEKGGHGWCCGHCGKVIQWG